MNRIPDETTILNFRHLLEPARADRGDLRRCECPILPTGASAALGHAGGCDDHRCGRLPTKNKSKGRDPGNVLRRRGQRLVFWGLKAHIGVRCPTGRRGPTAFETSTASSPTTVRSGTTCCMATNPPSGPIKGMLKLPNARPPSKGTGQRSLGLSWRKSAQGRALDAIDEKNQIG